MFDIDGVFFLTFSSNFDDHDYENYDPKEHRIPGRGQSATANQPSPSSVSVTPTLQMQLSGQEVSATAGGGGVSPQNNSSQVRASSSGSGTVTTTNQPTSTSPPLQGNDEAQEPPKSPNFNDRTKLLESQIGISPPQSPGALQRKKSSPAPPPPVRKSSSLTRSNQSSSSSLQESSQLDGRSRKASLPTSPHLEPKSNNTVARSKSIKLQAAKLQDLLSGKSSQNEADDEDEATSSIRSAAAAAREETQKSSMGSSSPLSRKLIKPNVVIPPVPTTKSIGVSQPRELGVVADSQVRSGDISSAVSQGSIDDELKSRLDQSLLRKKLGVEVISKATVSGLGESTTDTGEEDSDAKEYKPRLQMIKARVEKRRQEAAQAQVAQAVVNHTNSNGAGDISSTSTFVSGVSRPGDVSPITIPPLVPPKPHPGRPSGDSTTKGLDDKSSPFLPPLKTEETGGFMDDEEEPPPLPARTSAMFELEKSPPKKTKKPNYTNVSVASDQKEDVSIPPPPPTDTNKKSTSKKKGTNYPRVLLKKLKDKKEKTPEPSTSKTKGKDTSSSPTQSPTRKTNESPTRKEQPLLRSNSENVSNKPRPSSGPVIRVRPPMFINMRERPLPQIPGEIESNFEEPPDHTAEDYEQFELGQLGMHFYANYSNDPSHNYEEMEHQPPAPLPGRTAASVQRAHSFNPGDRFRQFDPSRSNPGRPSFDRSNFDPIPIPQPSPRSTDSPDYVDGYVNTELPMQLPTRGRQLPAVPSGMRAQQKPSDIDHSDYDYPDLRQHGFLAHTLPSRRKNPSPLAQPGITSRQWGNDGYPSVQQWPNQAPSEPEGDEMRDRLDSDYVPMASAFTMDDSYINWETIKDIRTQGGVADQGQQQRVVPPRGAGQVGAHPHPGYAMDDMYVNMPHGTSSTVNRFSAQEELAHIRQRLLPTRGFAPNTAPSQQVITPPVGSAETSSIGHRALGAPPSPKPKPKPRQRSATTAAALEDTLPLASVAPGSPHPPAPEQAWRMPPAIQPLVSQQAGQPGTDSSIYQNVDSSLSLPMSFGHHLREGLERRSSESDMLQLAIKPTTAALPPRNIPRRPQH